MKLDDLTPFEHDLIEQLAELSHRQWAGWVEWMLEKWHDTHQPDGEPFLARWARQCTTPYAVLSEEEKQSHREEALRMYEIFSAWCEAEPELTPEQEAELAKIPDLHCKPFLAKSLWHGLQQGVQWAVTKGGRELRDVRVIKPREADGLWCVLFMYREGGLPWSGGTYEVAHVGGSAAVNPVPFYSTDESAATTVIEQMYHYPEPIFDAFLARLVRHCPPSNTLPGQVLGWWYGLSNRPEVICRAALDAIEKEGPHA